MSCKIRGLGLQSQHVSCLGLITSYENSVTSRAPGERSKTRELHCFMALSMKGVFFPAEIWAK